MDPANNEFLAIFLEEAEDVLASWERTCLDLERHPTPAGFDALFRSAHNLKGSSRSVGLEKFGQFVHAVEDVIGMIKSGTLGFDSSMIQVFLDSHAFLVDWVHQLQQDPHCVDEERFRSLMAVISQIKSGTSADLSQAGSADHASTLPQTIKCIHVGDASNNRSIRANDW